MKKLLCLLLSVMLIAAFTACSDEQSAPEKPVTFYYLRQTISYNSESAVISGEKRESKEYDKDPAGLIQLYLNGPVTEGFRSPFPKDVKVRSFAVANKEVILELSADFGASQGLEHSLAISCLTKTVFQLTDTEKLTLLVEGKAESMVYSAEDVLYIDDATQTTD